MSLPPRAPAPGRHVPGDPGGLSPATQAPDRRAASSVGGDVAPGPEPQELRPEHGGVVPGPELPTEPLPRAFYARSATEVAPALLGARLWRRTAAGLLLGGTIVETEAYLGPQDLASHARSGPTRRNRVMFGPPGHAYVYFIYGMHWCLNVVTEQEGEAGAVLIRAVLPEVGVEEQRRLRGRPRDATERLAAGPARLCAALAIDGTLQGQDLTQVGVLWIAAPPDGQRPPVVVSGPRVGVAYAGDPWARLPYRFGVAGSPALSSRMHG